MSRIISVCNQKGGTGKSTTVIHLGVALAERGRKVLLVDLDPQGHLIEGFGFPGENLSKEISDVFEEKYNLGDILIKEIRPGIDLAPSNIRLSEMELTLVNMRFREYKLRQALEPIKNSYEFILLDCPPSLGLLTVNSLLAAKEVLVPMCCEYYSMLGLSLLIKVINSIKSEANSSLKILGIIFTRYKHTIHAREVIEKTKEELRDQIKVFDPVVNESTRFPEASGQGKTVFDIAPNIPGAIAYRKITKEIENG